MFVTESDGVAIELSDKKQASYIKVEEVVNPFGNCTPINQIMQEGKYSSRGKVVDSSNTQFILMDETELDAIMKQVTDLNLEGKSYIVLSDGGYSISQEHIQKSLNKAGYKGKFDCGIMFERLNGSYDYYVIIFNN